MHSRSQKAWKMWDFQGIRRNSMEMKKNTPFCGAKTDKFGVLFQGHLCGPDDFLFYLFHHLKQLMF